MSMSSWTVVESFRRVSPHGSSSSPTARTSLTRAPLPEPSDPVLSFIGVGRCLRLLCGHLGADPNPCQGADSQIEHLFQCPPQKRSLRARLHRCVRSVVFFFLRLLFLKLRVLLVALTVLVWFWTSVPASQQEVCGEDH